MYKIVNNLTPMYLFECLPESPPTARNYNTRQISGIYPFRARTTLFDRSYFPSTVRLWNQLPSALRESETLSQFKTKLRFIPKFSVKHSDLLFFGKRPLAIKHARLRMGCSRLKAHLFRIGVIDSPACCCGTGDEDMFHYFFICPLYWVHRERLQECIIGLGPFTIATLLYGCRHCTLKQNTKIFSAVHD